MLSHKRPQSKPHLEQRRASEILNYFFENLDDDDYELFFAHNTRVISKFLERLKLGDFEEPRYARVFAVIDGLHSELKRIAEDHAALMVALGKAGRRGGAPPPKPAIPYPNC